MTKTRNTSQILREQNVSRSGRIDTFPTETLWAIVPMEKAVDPMDRVVEGEAPEISHGWKDLVVLLIHLCQDI